MGGGQDQLFGGDVQLLQPGGDPLARGGKGSPHHGVGEPTLLFGPGLDDARPIAIAYGMRYDDDRQAQVPDAFSHDLRQRREGGADDRCRRNAEVFERGRVTRGPGRRRASMADTVDDDVARGGHLLGVWRCNAEIALLPGADARARMQLRERFRNAGEHEIGEFLVVVENADAGAVEQAAQAVAV